MELHHDRWTRIKVLLRDSWEKGEQYLRKIGTCILVCSIIIWAVSYFPHTPTNNEGDLISAEQLTNQQDESYLGKIGHFIEPVMSPLGFDWKASVALLTGVAAREVVVSPLAVIYQAD